MQVKFFKYLWLLPSIAMFQSCNVKDADNVKGPVTYNPSFSVPIGKYNMKFEEVFSHMGLGQNDTLQLIWFENNFYSDSIGYYDTTIFADFNFDLLNTQDEIIKSIMFRINYMVELPCKSTLQLYFNNNGSNILDSLFANGPLPIEAADTNRDGFVEIARNNQTDVFFISSKIDMLRQVSRLELHLRLLTKRDDNGYYKFLARYIVSVQLGIRVEIETDI
jgi:hypothetical protein